VVRRCLYRNHESITALRQGFNETRVGSRIAEYFAKLINNGIQTMVKIDKRIGRPEFLPQVFPGHNFARPFQQNDENLERLILQTHPNSRLAKLARAGIGFKDSELVDFSGLVNRHGKHHNRVRNAVLRCILIVCIVVTLPSLRLHAEQLRGETIAAFDHYVELSEHRMKAEEQSSSFLRVDTLPPTDREAALARLKKGEVVVDRIETLDRGRTIAVPDGLIHHWIGTTFIPGVTLAQTIAFLQDYDNQYKFYAPDVERSRLVARDGNNFKVFMRLRKKIAVLDSDYDVNYRWSTPDRAVSRSLSTRIAEVDNAGQKNESKKPVGNDNGYMWRLNSYWRFAQRDGGTYVQLEAVSLTRDIPVGLGWLIGPFISSIPKESLEFTLGRTREALLREAKPRK
jgi:hypothetical protein